jgi:hypothetical protein
LLNHQVRVARIVELNAHHKEAVKSFIDPSYVAKDNSGKVIVDVAHLSLLWQVQAVLIAADRSEAQNDSPMHLFQRWKGSMPPL